MSEILKFFFLLHHSLDTKTCWLLLAYVTYIHVSKDASYHISFISVQKYSDKLISYDLRVIYFK